MTAESISIFQSEMTEETQQRLISQAEVWLIEWEREHPESISDIQKRYLQVRLLYPSEAAAARAIGIDKNLVRHWIEASEGFTEARRGLLGAVQELVNQQIRQLLFKALQVHRELLNSAKEDVQLGAVRLVYSAAGMLSERVTLNDNRRQALIMLQQMEQGQEVEHYALEGARV